MGRLGPLVFVVLFLAVPAGLFVATHNLAYAGAGAAIVLILWIITAVIVNEKQKKAGNGTRSQATIQ